MVGGGKKEVVGGAGRGWKSCKLPNTCGNLSWLKGHTKAVFALHRHYWLVLVIRERLQ